MRRYLFLDANSIRFTSRELDFLETVHQRDWSRAKRRIDSYEAIFDALRRRVAVRNIVDASSPGAAKAERFVA
jgi:hypothetical protein